MLRNSEIYRAWVKGRKTFFHYVGKRPRKRVKKGCSKVGGDGMGATGSLLLTVGGRAAPDGQYTPTIRQIRNGVNAKAS